jgi:Zn-dependent peptidase ImmA (M78 family)
MATAHINPKIIPWALRRLNLEIDSLVTKNLPLEKIKAWISGQHPPTELQAEFLANRLRIPYLVLFLEEPPQLNEITLPDLRTVSGEKVSEPSVDFIDTLNAALIRQNWFKEYQLANGMRPLTFVGKFSTKDSVKNIAEDMRKTLGIDADFRHRCPSWTEFLRSFIRQAEGVGVLVMRNGVVEHSTKRRLNVKEFRGFAVSDPVAPLVFINDGDARAAQNFTLAHELAHIWIGQSGISNSPIERRNLTPLAVERFCNQIAAELLAPEEESRGIWRTDLSLEANLKQWTHTFRVSKLMALLRAYELEFIEYGVYKAEFDQELKRIKEEETLRKRKQKKKQQGDFWATLKLRMSDRFGRALVDGIRRDLTTYSEASSLLGVNICTVEEFMRRESA